MVNNQKEFNEKYPKEIKKIEIKRKKFAGQLVVEDYPELENLNFKEVISIDKITLKDLPQLQECAIWDCGIKELVIENCPRVEILNIRKNYLTNLGFLANLDSLEKLELGSNPELIEILKPYKGEWKIYQKDLQEIFELSKQNNFQGLAKKFWDLKKSREDLKKDVSILLSKETQQKNTSEGINTKELVLNLGKEFKEKEAKINYLESRTQELIDLSKQQKEKIVNAYLTHLGSEKESVEKLIKSYLEFTKFKKKETSDSDYRKKVKEYKKIYEGIEEELENKLGEETMNGVQRILTDCEKLVEQE
jgi:hypothetical protein